MTTKKLTAALMAFLAIGSFVTTASSPASAKGRFGGIQRPFHAGGFHDPVHGPGSSHNPTAGLHRPPFFGGPGRGFPFLPFPPRGPNQGNPPHGGPDRNWGVGGGYGGGDGRGNGMGRGFGGGGGSAVATENVVTPCGKQTHWSPKYQRCIPNYS